MAVRIIPHTAILEKFAGDVMGIVHRGEAPRRERITPLKFLPAQHSCIPEFRRRSINTERTTLILKRSPVSHRPDTRQREFFFQAAEKRITNAQQRTRASKV